MMCYYKHTKYRFHHNATAGDSTGDTTGVSTGDSVGDSTEESSTGAGKTGIVSMGCCTSSVSVLVLKCERAMVFITTSSTGSTVASMGSPMTK